MKPAPAIFRQCAQMLDVKPEDCLYVGDGGSQELTAARALGMRAVQAAWYLQPGSIQPVGLLADFPQAKSPMAILDYVD